MRPGAAAAPPEFERVFYANKSLRQSYVDWQERRLSGTTTEWLYAEIPAPFVRASEDRLRCAHIDLAPLMGIPAPVLDDDALVPVFKLLSPEHLLKLPCANDSNTLNRDFCEGCSYILGLEEGSEGSRRIICRRAEAEAGSLIENATNLLRVRGVLANLGNPDHYGATEEEQLFSIGLELCISWLNRIPFLNSSLFEISDLEAQTIHLAALKDRLKPGLLAVAAAWDWLASTYPAIAAHLAPFAEAATRRTDKGEFWWELRPCDYYAAFDEPKILWPDIAKLPRFSWDTEGVYVGNTGYLMPGEPWLLAMLSSRLLWFCVSQLSDATATAGGTLAVPLFQPVHGAPSHRDARAAGARGARRPRHPSHGHRAGALCTAPAGATRHRGRPDERRRAGRRYPVCSEAFRPCSRARWNRANG